jgi:SAM-dependent methyltransferase
MSNWDAGRYELIAERIEPAAEVAVAALGLASGERVLDAACGTGNAALVAARGGASAVGVDFAERLVGVARSRAAEEGLDATFEVADVTRIPAADDTFDAAVSVFGVIFAEPEATAAELVRVVRPGGRIVVTTWIPEGPLPRVFELIGVALDRPPAPPRWSDPAFIRRLFAPREVTFREEAIAFTAPSAEAYVDELFEHSPLLLADEPLLREAGRYDEIVEKASAILAEANEDPAAFRSTSRYYVVTVAV